jgi:alpha-L-rhamnosidase
LVVSLFLFSVQAMAIEPVKLEVTPVTPVRFEKRGDIYFADFGSDAYGNVEITLPKDTPAATITVRLGEKLNSDGTIDRKPPGSVSFREVKLKTSPDQQTYKLDIPTKERHKDPRAVHTPADIGEVAPFRYAEIEGSPIAIEKSAIKQLFVHAPFNDDASSFESSDETLNAVWNLCKHTMKATTAFGVYIDGERERIPYEADAYINMLSHYACDLDPRVAHATIDHLLKHPTWPTEWSFHMPMMAAADYQATGNLSFAADHYDALKKKLLIEKAGDDGLLRASAIVDWPAPERDGYNDGVADPKQKQQVGPMVNTVANAFYYRALCDMAMLAKALKKEDDARELSKKAEQVSAAFTARFFDATRGIYIDGEGSTHASLHANMFALAFGLVPADRQAKVADVIQSRGMACSVYGAQYLLEALFDAGRDDYAIGLMTSKDERSWHHMIDLGSTMTLEAWDAKFKPNLTWNHAWGAAPANVLSRYVLGVRPIEPGYKKILIAPQIGSLKFVRGRVPTPLGPVAVNVDATKLEVDVPAGTTARVVFHSQTAEVGPGHHLFEKK